MNLNINYYPKTVGLQISPLPLRATSIICQKSQVPFACLREPPAFSPYLFDYNSDMP
jgi:hypothetical protein